MVPQPKKMKNKTPQVLTSLVAITVRERYLLSVWRRGVLGLLCSLDDTVRLLPLICFTRLLASKYLLAVLGLSAVS